MWLAEEQRGKLPSVALWLNVSKSESSQKLPSFPCPLLASESCPQLSHRQAVVLVPLIALVGVTHSGPAALVLLERALHLEIRCGRKGAAPLWVRKQQILGGPGAKPSWTICFCES